jgi:hypothetical protein
MDIVDPGTVINWGLDWAWGLPLIVVTVVFHAFGLGLISNQVTSRLERARGGRNPRFVASFILGGTALWASLLHGFEATLWAITYLFLGAVQDSRSAMLYSLGAMTTYGHENLRLAPHWQMMGTLEALSGWILFGLTAAFLFAAMQRFGPRDQSRIGQDG